MKEKRNNLILALIFSVLLVCSWMIAFYSGWIIVYGKPEWYHYADAWGFGLLCFPICITCFYYWVWALGLNYN